MNLRTLALLAATVIAASAQADNPVAAGKALATDRNRGNCFSCHYAEGAEMPGNSGPALIQMQVRFPDRAVLREQIADPRKRNPDTVMPPYGAHGILTDEELDQVVEFVLSL